MLISCINIENNNNNNNNTLINVNVNSLIKETNKISISLTVSHMCKLKKLLLLFMCG